MRPDGEQSIHRHQRCSCSCSSSCSRRISVTNPRTIVYPIFGCRVKLLINRQTGEAVAMKMVDLKKHPDAANSVRKEVCIQKMLQDKHILRFFGKRSQGSVEYIFLEYAAGGELFDRIGRFEFNLYNYDFQSR